MKRFESKAVKLEPGRAGLAETVGYLNSLGADGWEPVCAVGQYSDVILLKRELDGPKA